jgi:hypothetical protein
MPGPGKILRGEAMRDKISEALVRVFGRFRNWAMGQGHVHKIQIELLIMHHPTSVFCIEHQ